VALDFLCLITGGAEVVNYFQDCFREPFGWNIAAIIELEREQYLESPPSAAHRMFFSSP